MSSPSLGTRVLHVDDEPGFAELTAEFIGRQDERLFVETEISADDALSRLEKNSIDCVVSDYDMPVLNGIEFLKEVREHHPDLPFILFTGKGSEEIASDAISAGVTDYLQKETGTEQYAVLANRITNVVEQYHAQRQTSKLTRRLEAILDNTTTPMFMKDDEGVYLLVNQGYVDLFGLDDSSDVVGQTDLDLFSEDDVSGILEHDLRVLTSGESVEVEERVPVNDEERVFLSSKVPIYDIGDRSAEDAPVAVFGVAKDITTLKEREQELKRHRELLEHTEHLATTGGWEADVGTGQQRWTEGTYAIHGLDPDGDFDPTVDSGIDFYHPDDQSEIARVVERCMELGEPYEVELRLVTDGGQLRWVRASGEAIEADGEIVKIRGAIQDITELKTRHQALEEQNERLGEFVNIVSHDLRSPLSVARGRLELARADDDPSDFDAVAGAHDRMDELIDELLELATAGTDAPDLQAVELARVVQEIRRYLDSPDSTFVNVDDLRFHADRTQLELLVGNLIGNAIEHGGLGVTITIGRLPNGWYIEDDGPGIPEVDREQVFESGFTTKPDGTGFGLDIVTRVVEAHGWSIRVTSSESGGARFEIRGIEFAD